MHCPTAGTTRKRGATRLADLPLPLTHTHTLLPHTLLLRESENEKERERLLGGEKEHRTQIITQV